MGDILHLLEADQRVLNHEPDAKAMRAQALRAFNEQFGHLGADRTPTLRAAAISSAASESADRLTLTGRPRRIWLAGISAQRGY